MSQILLRQLVWLALLFSLVGGVASGPAQVQAHTATAMRVRPNGDCPATPPCG